MRDTRHELRQLLAKYPPSMVVEGFLEWMSDKKVEQEKADEVFRQEDGDRVTDFLHRFEFETDNKKRAVIATELHQSRKKRRAAKDVARALKPIMKFMTETSNKYVIKQLRSLQYSLKKEEDFQAGEREYKLRVKDEPAEQSEPQKESESTT